jgi:dipeptidyl-peptidase 4
MNKISFFIVIVIFLGINIAKAQQNKSLPLNLDAIWSGYFNEQKLQPKLLNMQPAMAFIYADKVKNQELILSIDFKTGRLIDTIFNNFINKQGDTVPTVLPFFADFEMSNDDNFILIKTEEKPYQFCTIQSLDYVWDRTTKNFNVVTGDGRILYATFSPDSKQLAYIYLNNIYIKNLITNKYTQVTFDGQSGYLNGIADPNYQNGFGVGKMFEWSADSKKIAFLKLNVNSVKNYPITSFEVDAQYGVVDKSPYPMPGTPAAEPNVFIFDVPSQAITKIDVGTNPNIYIPNLKWNGLKNEVLVEVLDITQKEYTLFNGQANNGTTKNIYNYKDSQYVKVYANNMFTTAEGELFFIKEVNGKNIIVSFANNVTTEIPFLNNEIVSINSFNKAKNTLYLKLYETDGKESNLYSYNITLKQLKKITSGDGSHNVLIDKTFSCFIDESCGINTPYAYQMFTIEGKKIDEKLIKNIELQKRLTGYVVPETQLLTVTVNNNNAFVIRPKNLKTSARKAIIYMYGGQGKQLAQNTWFAKEQLTLKYFAQQGYIVASIDPRGTNGKGAAFSRLANGQPGLLESQDILALKKYIKDKYNIPDNNFAIIGESYGGFLSSSMATTYAGNFAAYIAIAPVTDWRLYFKTYTERLLQRPSENFANYVKYAPSSDSAIAKYKENTLLLIHGTKDDNVHFQNSMFLSKVLQENNKLFDQYFFPERNHNISSGEPDRIKINMYRKIEAWLAEKIK